MGWPINLHRIWAWAYIEMSIGGGLDYSVPMAVSLKMVIKGR